MSTRNTKQKMIGALLKTAEGNEKVFEGHKQFILNLEKTDMNRRKDKYGNLEFC